MHHAFIVRGREACAELARDFERLIPRQPPDAPQQRGQILAVHVFHRQIGGALGFADIVHTADVRMRDLPRDAHFVAETRERGLIRRPLSGKELEGHCLGQQQIVSTIDFAHATAAQQAHDPITLRQQGSRREPALVHVAGRGSGTARLVLGFSDGTASVIHRRAALPTELVVRWYSGCA